MSKKKADQKAAEEQLPSQYDQGEAPDTDARLHGDDSVPAEAPVVDGTEPDEAQLPIPAGDDNDRVNVRVQIYGVPRQRVASFVEHLRHDGIEADVVEPFDASPAETGVTGEAQAESQLRAFHRGYEEALRKVAVEVDGVHMLPRAVTLAEMLDHNDARLNAQLKALRDEQAQEATV